jgi:D-alanine-D-alanine ligase
MRPAPDVLILAGGLSHERDVSLRSGRRVAEYLREAGCTVRGADVGTDLLPTLIGVAGKTPGKRPDLVWPLLHGKSGEDGSIQDVLELCGIPYLGSGPRSARAAWNKAVAKNVVARQGLSTPRYVTLPQSLFQELGASQLMDLVTDRFKTPLVVKPLSGGSALGVSLVTDPARLGEALMQCFAYGDTALIERAKQGTELAISVVDLGDGPFALPAVEIVTDGAYDYDARYNPGRAEFFTPARLSDDVASKAAELAVAAHQALGLVRYSRTDAIVDADGEIWFLEANVAPGLQETSLLPQAALAAGYDLPQLYRGLVEASIANG